MSCPSLVVWSLGRLDGSLTGTAEGQWEDWQHRWTVQPVGISGQFRRQDLSKGKEEVTWVGWGRRSIVGYKEDNSRRGPQSVSGTDPDPDYQRSMEGCTEAGPWLHCDKSSGTLPGRRLQSERQGRT